jgi:hypothetical protein
MQEAALRQQAVASTSGRCCGRAARSRSRHAAVRASLGFDLWNSADLPSIYKAQNVVPGSRTLATPRLDDERVRADLGRRRRGPRAVAGPAGGAGAMPGGARRGRRAAWGAAAAAAAPRARPAVAAAAAAAQTGRRSGNRRRPTPQSAPRRGPALHAGL